VLIVEDIIAAGLSSRESWRALAERPRRVAPAMLDIPACAPDALPPELAALPPVKPGSRPVAGAA
jgi:orotate phosphoribosyltransferase